MSDSPKQFTLPNINIQSIYCIGGPHQTFKILEFNRYRLVVVVIAETLVIAIHLSMLLSNLLNVFV